MYPYITNIYFLNYSILILFIILRLIGYFILLMGWSSNSIYSIIGSIRSIAQILSYEVRFILIVLVLIILRERYSFFDFIIWQNNIWYMFILLPIFIIFFIRTLAELNRRPIDFIEGESELVSGFNVEYFSGGFALIFISEYGIILFFRLMIIYLFTKLLIYKIYIFLFINIFRIIIIFIRGILPRIRYDELIYLCWKIFLPLVLSYLIIILGIKFIFLVIY